MSKKFNEWWDAVGDGVLEQGYTVYDIMDMAYEAGYKQAVETLTQHIRIDPDK